MIVQWATELLREGKESKEESKRKKKRKNERKKENQEEHQRGEESKSKHLGDISTFYHPWNQFIVSNHIITNSLAFL